MLNHHFEKESFQHPGIHIHAKIIAADPFGPDPIIITGSANYSAGSTLTNDSNSLVVRGNTAVADIYSTEFMRMFEHYLFRYAQSKEEQAAAATGNATSEPELALKEDDSWSEPYYVPGSHRALERQMFAGTSEPAKQA
jgi:phosphatidylserine/phosphatidylglycerophosphate/cardiolipin synthase-like enzyme